MKPHLLILFVSSILLTSCFDIHNDCVEHLKKPDDKMVAKIPYHKAGIKQRFTDNKGNFYTFECTRILDTIGQYSLEEIPYYRESCVVKFITRVWFFESDMPLDSNNKTNVIKFFLWVRGADKENKHTKLLLHNYLEFSYHGYNTGDLDTSKRIGGWKFTDTLKFCEKIFFDCNFEYTYNQYDPYLDSIIFNFDKGFVGFSSNISGINYVLTD